jgi:hypothetical protein
MVFLLGHESCEALEKKEAGFLIKAAGIRSLFAWFHPHCYQTNIIIKVITLTCGVYGAGH